MGHYQDRRSRYDDYGDKMEPRYYDIGGGASHLARIHGTEEDRVNCPFYFKIGACRHGDTCSRVHNKPAFSQTVIIPQMYENPIAVSDPMNQYQILTNCSSYEDQYKRMNADGTSGRMSKKSKEEEDFEDFYIDVFEELSSFGEIDELVVCDNLGDHLVGNVYVKYFDEEDAAKCQKSLHGRFFAGRQLKCEFSPVTDFREARCRQFHDNHCNRSGDCNFIHTKRISKSLVSELLKLQKYAYKRSNPERYKKLKKERREKRSRKRSRTPSGSRTGSASGSERNGKEERKRNRKSRSRSK